MRICQSLPDGGSCLSDRATALGPGITHLDRRHPCRVHPPAIHPAWSPRRQTSPAWMVRHDWDTLYHAVHRAVNTPFPGHCKSHFGGTGLSGPVVPSRALGSFPMPVRKRESAPRGFRGGCAKAGARLDRTAKRLSWTRIRRNEYQLGRYARALTFARCDTRRSAAFPPSAGERDPAGAANGWFWALRSSSSETL